MNDQELVTSASVNARTGLIDQAGPLRWIV